MIIAISIIFAVAYLTFAVIAFNIINKQDKRIADLQRALVDAYTELEFQKLGISKKLHH